MIVPAKGGFQVKSEGGKNLSKPGMSKDEAQKRLAQIEMFKAMAAKKGK